MLGFLLKSSTGAGAPASTYSVTSSTGLYPKIAVEVDFATAPTDTPRTWTNVTDYVRTVSYSLGGRQHELSRTDAGTLTCVLDNRDGRFDPTNTGGAYYPNVKRMRWIRVMAQWDSVEYPRWSGLIESWQQDWPSGGMDATVVIRAVDAFKILALFDLGGQSFPEALSGSRVASVLAAANVPYSADAGNTTIVASDNPISTGTKALGHLQDVVESENGLLFADRTGQIAFQDRHYRATTASSITAVGTIGDGGGTEIPYRSGQLDSDDAEVWPTVEVTPTGGTVETAYDATSRDDHYDRVLTRTILSSSQTEALAAAQYLSGLYADPSPRIPQVELLPQNYVASWPTVLGLENSQRLTWIRRAAATIQQDVFVERISESVQPGRGWAISLQLSPASDLAYWLLGTAGFSELGETTVLGY
jgi:hypothetical protein